MCQLALTLTRFSPLFLLPCIYTDYFLVKLKDFGLFATLSAALVFALFQKLKGVGANS